MTDLPKSHRIDLQAQEIFYSFLNKVAGINRQNYNVTILSSSTSEILNSNKTHTIISARINNKIVNLSIQMIIIEGKVQFYTLGLLSGTLEVSELSIDNCLAKTKEIISKYREVFNAEYCDSFDSILPSTLNTMNKTLNNDTLTVNIQVNEQSKTPLKYTTTTWHRCICNTTVKALKVQSTVSKTGMLTSFIDTMGVYEIATTDVSITKEVALKIAMPYIEEYATVNGRKIGVTDVTFAYARDLDGSRGDSILIYPQWCVSTLFDSSEDDVYGFYVSIWADNGVVASANPQGAIGLNNSVPYDLIYMIIIGAATIAIITTVLFIKKKRNF